MSKIGVRRVVTRVTTLMVVLALGSVATLGAQDTQSTKASRKSHAQATRLRTKGSEGRGDAASDQNIKVNRHPADRAAMVPLPPAKGGIRTRGGNEAESCPLHVDSRYGLPVDVYIDGTYVGTVPPNGDLIAPVECGVRILYARVDLESGFYEWEPATRSVGASGFTWELDP